MGHLQDEIAGVDAALAEMNLGERGVPGSALTPSSDARFEALSQWLDIHLLTPDGGFRADERLVVFTEYKTTLDYLARRLSERHPVEGAVRLLFGGMDLGDREELKAAFNDPADPVRILVATDTGSEGQNLQEIARYLLHFDVAWNPARLEQRNGRLDRLGQARDVRVFHFTSKDDADLRFLAYVIGQVNQIRDDLGSVGEVFDAAFQQRFVEGQDERAVRAGLDAGVNLAKGRSDVPRKSHEESLERNLLDGLVALKSELDLDPATLQETLDVALSVGVGGPWLIGPNDRGKFQLRTPVPRAWEAVVDDSLRARTRTNQTGVLLNLTFNPDHFVEEVAGRPVFRPQRDTALLHLGHPVFHQALSTFARHRFPGSAGGVEGSRWTVQRGQVPEGAEALLLLTVEELALNELREAFHHWVRTLRVPVVNGELVGPLPHAAASTFRADRVRPVEADTAEARRLWEEVGPEVRGLMAREADALTQRLRAALEAEYRKARDDEQARFRSRQGELSRLIAETTLQRLEGEIEELKREREQGVLFDRDRRLAELDADIRGKEEEVQRRQQHYDSLRKQLEQERKRVLEHLLPRRYRLRGKAQVFPVTVEIRLPEWGSQR